MNATRGRQLWARGVVGLMLGLAVLSGLIEQPPVAHTAGRIAEAAARVQVVIKKMKILHDHDTNIVNGDLGEIRVWAHFWRCLDRPIAVCTDTSDGIPGTERVGLLAQTVFLFSASTGETYTLDRLLPSRDDTMYGPETSYALGIPLYPDDRYAVYFSVEEMDGGWSDPDQMGEVLLLLTPDSDWGVGTHTQQGRLRGGKPGTYEVEFEVRRVPLPDLRAGRITVNDLPGTSKKLVCMGVTNHELMDADAFETVLAIDGAVPPGGRGTPGRLKGGTSGDFCVEAELPAGGQHTLRAIADASHLVAETNETNNVYEMPYPATPPKTGQPEPIKPYADLSVITIKLNGQAPDGKDDCKNGKNTVVVTLKYTGKGAAELFTTRLTADGVDVAELSRVGLEPGQEHELRFEGVQLKKGEHQLTATVDANSQIPETDEGNNALTVTARCSG